MWENVADMGQSDKVSRYRCLSCQEFIPGQEGRMRLLADEHHRFAAAAKRSA